ncbi:MAG: ferrochelatase [Deltaproteobacteria bacterium]|nr:MAG: ferrochelatase [Deltaproteobacteria bacterium]
MTVPTTGVLLVNLGTPDAPTTRAVRRYLREFLMDPRVLDISGASRWALVNLIIAPTRSPKSAAAYREVWTERGSPLLVASQDLTAAVQQKLGPRFKVALGMRYQNPSIGAALEELRREPLDRLVVVPLFPQYSSAASGSAVEKVFEELAADWNIPSVRVLADFYEHPGFIQAQATVAQRSLASFEPDRVLMSFHGLPERHVKKSWAQGFSGCDLKGPCPPIGEGNRYCYRAQCYATARALAKAMGLSEGDYEVSFQSRLGRDPWIKPYTDLLLPKLAQRGVKRLAVMCPAFVADCLETLEEIGIRAREDWRAAGGEALHLIPCVNAEPEWAEAVAEMVRVEAAPTR